MFASSNSAVRRPAPADAPPSVFGAAEGRWSGASRRSTASLLLPHGRPGAWLLLLAGSCTYVVVQTLLLRLA